MKHLPSTLTLAICLITGASPAWADEPQKIVKAIVVEKDGSSNLEEVIADTKKRGMDALKAGQYVEAARELWMCVRLGAKDSNVEQGLLEAKQHVGTVRVVVTEPDTSLMVDGNPYLRWPDTGPE